MSYIKLECSKSSSINSYFLNSNFGLNPIVEIYAIPKLSVGEVSRSLFQFSLSSLQEKMNLGKISLTSNSTSAYLNIYNVYSSEPPPQTVVYDFYTLNEEWDEGFGFDETTTGVCNWRYRKDDVLWSLSGGSFSGLPFASVTSDIPSADFRVDIKEVLKGWTTTSTNCGIIIKLSDIYENSVTSNESKSYTIKKLFARNTNTILHPFIGIQWNDKFTDDVNSLYFGSTGNIYFYNKINGMFSDIDGTNDFPGILSLTGIGRTVLTGSGSSLTSVILTDIQGIRNSKGIYKFSIPTISYTAAALSSIVANWTITSSLSAVKEKFDKQLYIKSPIQNNSNDYSAGFQINVSNFKSKVVKGDILEYNLFVKRKIGALETLTASSTSISSYIITNGFWKLVDEKTGIDVIPWENLNYNDQTNFFSIDTQFLTSERPYRIIFKFIEMEKIFIYDSPEYYYQFYLE